MSALTSLAGATMAVFLVALILTGAALVLNLQDCQSIGGSYVLDGFTGHCTL